jgi:hypothetical protein
LGFVRGPWLDARYWLFGHAETACGCPLTGADIPPQGRDFRFEPKRISRCFGLGAKIKNFRTLVFEPKSLRF